MGIPKHLPPLGRGSRLDRFRGVVLAVLCVAVPAAFILGSAFDIGPALAARAGHGTLGSFTVTSRQCEQNRCNWVGTFQPDDPSVPGWLDMQIYGNDVSGIGAQVPAIDTGDDTDVFPIGGGGAWMGDLAMLAIGTVLFPPALYFVVIRPWWRRRRLRHTW